MRGSRLQKEARYGSPHLLKSRRRGVGSPTRPKAPATSQFTVPDASNRADANVDGELADKQCAWLVAQFLLHYCDSALASRALSSMRAPTAGELKRILASDEFASMRVRLRSKAKDAKLILDEVEDSIAQLEALRQLTDDDLLVVMLEPSWDAEVMAKCYRAICVAAAIWLLELAQAGLGELVASRAANLDSALPPADATAVSSRGRF